MDKKGKILAIIPARGGSKRIPKKNIRLFLGKPIIAYSIEVALNSGLFDEVMVSTDSSEIAQVALEYGAKVPFLRTETTSNDFATTAQVIHEVLDSYAHLELEFEFLCCLYPCAPFISTEIVKQGFEIIKNENLSTVFPVVPFSFPIQRALKIENGLTSFVNPEHALTRSQDLPVRYQDAGQFYWLNVYDFQKCGLLVGERAKSIIISDMEAQDIDNEMDWEIAQIKFKMK